MKIGKTLGLYGLFVNCLALVDLYVRQGFEDFGDFFYGSLINNFVTNLSVTKKNIVLRLH